MKSNTRPSWIGLGVLLFLIGSLASNVGETATRESTSLPRTFQGGLSRESSAAAFSPDGRLIIIATGDGTATLYDARTGVELRTFPGDDGEGIRAVVFSPKGRYVLAGNEAGSAALWDVQTGMFIRAFTGQSEPISSVSFSPDGRYALTGIVGTHDGSSQGSAVLWDGRTGAKIRAFDGHKSGVNSAVFSPDGRFVLTGSQDNTAKLWDVQTGVQIQTFSGHRDSVLAVSFSSDGRFALTGSRDGTARIWDTQTGAAIRSFSHEGIQAVSSAVFSPDGRFVHLGIDGNAFETWDAQSGAKIRSAAGQAFCLAPPVFSPDGRFVLTGYSCTRATLWNEQTGRWVLDTMRTSLGILPTSSAKSTKGSQTNKSMGNDPFVLKSTEQPPFPQPAEVAVTRYPTMETQDRVVAEKEFSVEVSLTTEQITRKVSVTQGPTTADGQLRMSMPDRKEWTIDVSLAAEGFDFKDNRNTAQISLPRMGDSTPALFKLTPQPISTAQESRKLFATLWHEGRYLAKIQRTITVISSSGPVVAEPVATSPSAPGPPPARAPAATISSNDDTYTPDLTVYLMIAPDPRSPQTSWITLNSPDLVLTWEPFPTPSGMADWLTGHYHDISAASRGIAPGWRPESSAPSTVQKEKNVALLEGLGRELYERFAPAAFKRAFWHLYDKLGVDFASIQIFTNDPALPWELMRPERPDGSDQQDFLGIGFRVARWHVSQSTMPVDSPPAQVPLEALTVIAPEYQGASALPGVAEELTALRRVAGYQQIAGRFAELKKLFASKYVKQGIIHYAGHGTVRDLGKGIKGYAINLEDSELDVMTWRGLTAPLQALKDRSHPFFFFNACDIGQADQVANFVDGWAPAVLENGASGFIGGLWPLGDTGAASFATRFYSLVKARLAEGPASVAQILQQTRQQFHETGDPTFLAYVYYGYPNFRLLPPGASKAP